ncbi:HAD family phosphatase [uncultured Lutibacter sp.]|uniref:HAD family hydrolase n=1 Tax=uncultured Lutibacter sp. TaxID=437739 RepID=UPI0026238BE5|nr:HAD family phosphatase [uncultured Lutibacter sp.]
MSCKIDTIIFDLGGVLVDWNPKYVYLKAFNNDETKVNWFLNTVCSSEWNLQQDAGRTIAEANAIKIEQFPEYKDFIKLFYDKWPDMFKGPINENVAIFNKFISSKNYKVYALTNWSAEKWEKALELFPFFKKFDGVVVSGKEKVIKPNPEIYKTLFTRFKINPEKAVFIDDNLENIIAAKKLKLTGICYSRSVNLMTELNKLNIYI